MSERWEGPSDGALRREREGVSDRTNGVLEPGEAASPGEGAMHGPTADQPEPDKPPGEPLDEAPALADSEQTGPDTEPGRFEERLRRVEDALAQLQDIQGMETRVVERVASQIQSGPPADPSSAGALWEAGKKVLASAGAVATPERAEPTSTARQGVLGFLREMVVEVRAMVYMFVDPRYRISWWGRGSALVLFALLLVSFWWVPGTALPVVGYWINKVADLVLAYFLVKTLGREARRYRELAPWI